jgi:hydrogenase nickel incorporation protein HypA/HybF
MHELSISSAIVDTALRHAGGQRVTRVDVRIGALRQVVPESLDFYFEIVSRDTDCSGAALEIELVEALMGCPTCGHEWDPAPEPKLGASTAARLGYASHAGHEAMAPVLPVFRCPACERADADVLSGDELEVESIEIAEEEQCIAPR